MIGVANYALIFTVDAPYLLEDGVDVSDFPVPVKIPIGIAPHLFGTGETGDTIYFESEGIVLKHECVGIEADYAYFWVKLDLSTSTKVIVTLHYGALVDNNYEDKRGVWVNAASIYHFHGNANDTMGIANGTASSANVVYGTQYGMNYKGVYIPSAEYIDCGAGVSVTMPYTIMLFGRSLGNTPIWWGYHTGNPYSFRAVTTYTLYIETNGSANNAYFQAGLYTYPSNCYNLYTATKTITGNNLSLEYNLLAYTPTYAGTLVDTMLLSQFGRYYNGSGFTAGNGIYLAEAWIFSGEKSTYWKKAMHRMYRNPDAYIEYGTEVDLDNLTDFTDEKVCCIANIVRQLEIYDYDFKKMVYEVGDKNAYWRPPGSEGIYVWGKLEMRPLYGEDVSFVDNLYANDAYFYTFTDYTYDVHDKLVVEGVIYDIQAIQVHDAGRETIYKTLVLKRQPEYYACCVGVIS